MIMGDVFLLPGIAILQYVQMRSDATGAARLCVTNAKGGTGKTTVAINIAGALHERGRDVLFVDTDPQGNATEGLGLVEAYDSSPPTMFDVFTDADVRNRVEDLIVEHEEMDVLPSSIDLLQAEQELTIADLIAKMKADSERAGVRALEAQAINVTADSVSTGHALDVLLEALEGIEDDYDYVIVDSPPFYGKLTDTAIFATRNVVVPALTEASSERAIELLIEQIAALEDHVDITVDTAGIVANRVEKTNEDQVMLGWLNEVFTDCPVWEIRKRVALQRAFSAGKSIFAYDQPVDMEAAFLEIATDLDRQFGYTKVTA
jgi:chromosome partitioning protein